MKRRYLSIKEASEYTGLSPNTLYKWTEDEKFPHIDVGPKLVKFDKEEIDQWMKEHKHPVKDFKDIASKLDIDLSDLSNNS